MALLGSVVGYLIVKGDVYILGALLAFGLLLLTLHRPYAFAFIAMAFTAMSGLVKIETLGATFRLPEYAWWLAGGGIVVLAVFGHKRLHVSKATWLLALYAGFLMASTLWAGKHSVAVRESVQFMTFPVIFLVMDNAVRTIDQLDRALKLFLVSCSFLIVGALVSNVFYIQVLPALRVIGGGLRVGFSDGYYGTVATAAYAGAVTMIATALLLSGRGSRVQRLALGALVISALALQAVVLKRVELVGLLAGGILLFSFYGWKRQMLYMALTGVVVFSALIALSGVRAHFEQLRSVEAGSSTKWHYALPLAGWMIFKEDPVLGAGAGAYEYKMEKVLNSLGMFKWDVANRGTRLPHDIFIYIVLQVGIVGLGLFLWFLAVVLLRMWRACAPGRERVTWREHLCRGALAGFCVEFIVSLAQNPQYWIPWWFVLALGYRAASISEGEPSAQRARAGRRAGALEPFPTAHPPSWQPRGAGPIAARPARPGALRR